MALPQSKMPHFHARLRILLLIFLLPQLSQAATTTKPRSQAFWHKFCGFFCPYQLSCDSDVYLSSQQQLDLLNSQEFLDILELFPQILLENEKLQHTTLVRLEDHQRDLILLRYKDFFHPRETLPLARQRIVRQYTKDHQGVEGALDAEPSPQQITEPSEIFLTENQVQNLIRNSVGLDDNRVQLEVPLEKSEELGTPDWNEAEGFIRDYVDKQRMRQFQQTYSQEDHSDSKTSREAASAQRSLAQQSRRDNTVALNIDHLQDDRVHLNVDRILSELKKMGHSFNFHNLNADDFQDLDEIPEPEAELHRTTDVEPTVLNQPEDETGETADKSESVHSRGNRISDRKSANSKEPYSDSKDARTLPEHFSHHQTNLPSKQQLTQAYLNSPPLTRSKSIQRRRSKRVSASRSSSAQRQNPRHYHPRGLIHEPGGRAEEDRDPGGTSKRLSRRKREVVSIEVCPVVETWSNMVLAETLNGTLIQIAQFPEVNLEQWFLEERCMYENSPIIRGVTCEIRERLVDAVVIPLVDPTKPIQTTKIKIDCCKSMYNVDLGTK